MRDTLSLRCNCANIGCRRIAVKACSTVDNARRLERRCQRDASAVPQSRIGQTPGATARKPSPLCSTLFRQHALKFAKKSCPHAPCRRDPTCSAIGAASASYHWFQSMQHASGKLHPQVHKLNRATRLALTSRSCGRSVAPNQSPADGGAALGLRHNRDRLLASPSLDTRHHALTDARNRSGTGRGHVLLRQLATPVSRLPMGEEPSHLDAKTRRVPSRCAVGGCGQGSYLAQRYHLLEMA